MVDRPEFADSLLTIARLGYTNLLMPTTSLQRKYHCFQLRDIHLPRFRGHSVPRLRFSDESLPSRPLKLDLLRWRP
jgi:hypothetical protein